MLAYPFSLLLLPAAVLLGVIYVTAGRLPRGRGQRACRVVLLALTWLSPLAISGPGVVRLTLGLLVGYLGIRMVALAERWRARRRSPTAVEIAIAMIVPEELLSPVPQASVPAPPRALLQGLLGAAACVSLLVVGNRLRLWHWSRPLDDLLVLVEVGVGTWGIHGLIVGAAGAFGRPVGGLQDAPIRSASFSQFWARRWNHLVQGNLDRAFFRPYGRRRRWIMGTLTAFTASGIMHVIAVLDPTQPELTLLPSAAVMGFFLINGGLILLERRLGWHRQPHGRVALFWARVRTLVVFTLLSPMLLDPFASIVHVHGRALGDP